MKVLNFGSLNIDYVYEVDHIVKPGETCGAKEVSVYPGGKGLNQSVAVSKAGIEVYHAGMIGKESNLLLDVLNKYGVNIEFIEKIKRETGKAIIQLDKNGENSIIISHGANYCNTLDNINKVLSNFTKGDIVILQNEINLVSNIIDRAHRKKMIVVFNPSPINDSVLKCDFGKVDYLLINETEGKALTKEEEPKKILKSIYDKYPKTKTVLTLGSKGSMYYNGESFVFQKAYKTKVVDTTAAGDTYTGYFINGLVKGKEIGYCMEIAAKASALAVSKKGAAVSIPYYNEIDGNYMKG